MRPFRRASRARRLLVALAVGALTLGLAPATAQAAIYPPQVTGLSIYTSPLAGGELLTIHGSDFQHANEVTFGRHVVTAIRYINSETLQVRVPRVPYPGTVYVRVRTPAGLSPWQGDDEFEYIGPPVVTSISPAYANSAGGQDVTIHGRNLTGISRVRFGNMVVSGSAIHEVNSTAAQAVTPRHPAGIYTVLVRTPYGVSQPTKAAQVHFYPQPEVETLSVTDGRQAGGETVRIIGRNFVDVTSVAFGTASAAHYTVVGPGTIVATTPGHAPGLFNVSVTSRFGTSYSSDATRFRFGPLSARHWGTPVSVDPLGGSGVPQISCSSSTFCALADEWGGVATYDGSRWTVAVPGKSEGSATLYCYSERLCFDWVDDSKADYPVYIWNGDHWDRAPATTPPQLVEQTVACTSDTSCRLFDRAGDEYTFDGSTWTASGQHIDGLVSLSCTSSTSCFAVSGQGQSYQLSGTAWAAVGTPVSNQIDQAWCSASGYCMADLGGIGNLAVYDGSWTELPPTSFALSGFGSCAGPKFCAVTDRDGNAWTFDGSTQEWNGPIELGLGASALSWYPISCSDVDSCVVASGSGVARTFDGTNVGPLMYGDPFHASPKSVSCPQIGRCVVLDQYGNTVEQTSGGWSTPTHRSPAANSISCPTTTFCATVGQYFSDVYRDGTWRPFKQFDSSVNLTAVSCASSAFCVAIGHQHAVVYEGGQWLEPTPLVSLDDLVGISCVSDGNCVAVTADDYVLTMRNGEWEAEKWLTGATSELHSITCSALTRCLIGMYDGGVVTYDAGSTTVVQNVLPRAVIGISCTSASSCDVVSTDRTAHYDGSVWTASTPLAVYPNLISGLSCVGATSTCVVVEQSGDAYQSSLG